MTAEQAIDVVARHLISAAMAAGLETGTITWEDWPDLSQHDFDEVVERAEKICHDIRASVPVYREAYALLSERAAA